MPPTLEPLEGRRLRSMTPEAELMTDVSLAETVIVMENETDPAKAQAEANRLQQLYATLTNILRMYNEAAQTIVRNLG